MNNQIKKKLNARAQIIKSLAHPTRLFIVDELAKGSRCVCELQQMIGDDTSTVSKHLTLLKHAGIVEDEKKGTMVFYSLKIPCTKSFFECIESVIKKNAKEQLETVS